MLRSVDSIHYGPRDISCTKLNFCIIFHKFYQQFPVTRIDAPIRSFAQDVGPLDGWMCSSQFEANLDLTTHTHNPVNTVCTTETHTPNILNCNQNQHKPHGPGSNNNPSGCGEAVGCLGETISGQKWMLDPSNIRYGRGRLQQQQDMCEPHGDI